MSTIEWSSPGVWLSIHESTEAPNNMGELEQMRRLNKKKDTKKSTYCVIPQDVHRVRLNLCCRNSTVGSASGGRHHWGVHFDVIFWMGHIVLLSEKISPEDIMNEKNKGLPVLFHVTFLCPLFWLLVCWGSHLVLPPIYMPSFKENRHQDGTLWSGDWLHADSAAGHMSLSSHAKRGQKARVTPQRHPTSLTLPETISEAC